MSGGGNKGSETAAKIREGFAAVAAATDTPSPGDGSSLPVVHVKGSVSLLARTLGMHLRSTNLFRFNDGLVTVDNSGSIAPMQAERFITWVEQHASLSPGSLNKNQASTVLAADQFRENIRELKGVALVRQPVWRTIDGVRTVELAEPGFDKDAAIYTVEAVRYRDDMDPKEGFAFLLRMLQEFPFDPEGEAKVPLRRSYAAQMAAMMGVFLANLFPEGTTRPLTVYNGNQPGSGKSLLMRMALMPIHGDLPESGRPACEAEMEKILDGAALARLPFLVLDDVTTLRSQALNRFATSRVHQLRRMHSQTFLSVPKCTSVFLTGNGLVLTADLERRALVVDLFEAGEVRGRAFATEITTDLLSREETRADFLAALWSLVRVWRDQGMPLLQEGTLPSFEAWSELIGGVVTSCRLPNPFKPRAVETGGDESTRALNAVLASLVAELDPPSEGEPDPQLTTDAVLARAEEMALLDDITSFAKEPRKSLGWRLKRLRGRHLWDSSDTPRKYEFSRRSMAQGSIYRIKFLS